MSPGSSAADLLEASRDAWAPRPGCAYHRLMSSRLTAVVLDADDPDRLHLHLISADAVEQRTIVGRVIRLGGDHLDVGQRPEERHVVLVDPKGNALCVIAPGNAFLVGCGPLGEVACDGSRRVG
ncbi:VOC family protein, partial [uncultured Arsenicicoccus sp.]